MAAASFVLSSSRPTSETTSTPSISLMPSRCLRPKAPAPASATLIVFVMNGPRGAGSVRVVQDEMADGGVRRGHVKEAMDNFRRRPAGDVRHRAPRNKPHHELDALTAR